MTAVTVGARLKDRCKDQRSQAAQGDRERRKSLTKRKQLRFKTAGVNDRHGIIHEAPLYCLNPAAANRNLVQICSARGPQIIDSCGCVCPDA